MDITNALISLKPNAQWSLNGDSYDGLQWHDKVQSKPTQEEIENEIVRLQQEFETNEYQRNRAKEYPSIVDQLDKLYHDGYDGWKQMITEIKEQYPKP
jgi:hypothetical protein